MNKQKDTSPKNRALGAPLPNSTHAVSVSLPAWRDVIGYEEKEPRVINALKAGYPRFIYHPIIEKLIARYHKSHCRIGESCLIFPSERMAKLCSEYIIKNENVDTQIHKDSNVSIVTYPKHAHETAHQFLQHAGGGISSRQAEDILSGKTPTSAQEPELVKAIATRVAKLNGLEQKDTYIFSSGMTAFYETYKALTKLKPNAKTIQIGFPYVDSLKIQQRFDTECYLIADNNLDQLKDIILQEPIAAVFCELPSNPELRTIDLPQLSSFLKEHNTPLVIDDTVASFQLDVAGHADIIITSLTKTFSGTGDVLAGSLSINNSSKWYDQLTDHVKNNNDSLYIRDLEVLERNSINVRYRIRKLSQNTDIIVNFLKTKLDQAEIFHPSMINTKEYNSIKRSDGGYGSLLSISLKTPTQAPLFYNTLKMCKGPSLGTSFTLACPYVLLAHYFELNEVKKYGIDPNLIRISIGLEAPETIIADLTHAFNTIS
jgi:cystathionine gamma-synthase